MMKTNFTRSILILAAMSIFSGCASDSGGSQGVSSKPVTDITKQMAHILAASKSTTMYFMEVPSPNNFLSEKIMLATMALGDGSTAIDQLAVLLEKDAHGPIGIVGDSQAINVMTVKQSLKKVAGKHAKGTIYLIANAKIKEELMTLNQEPNLNIIVVTAQP